MSDTDIWNDPDLATSDDYVKFENVGDTITGTILSVRKHVFDDGKVAPQVLLDVNGEQKTLTAGQVRLKAALVEQKPKPGDVITVTLSQVEKRAGGKTLKHFDVTIGGTAPAAAAPAAADTGYTPEQIEAMKLLGIAPPA